MRVKSLRLAVSCAAVALFLLLWTHYLPHAWSGIALLTVLGFVTENFALELPLLGSVSLSFGIEYAAILYAGPVGAAIVAGAGLWSVQDLRDHKPWYAMAFNAAQLALSAMLAGVVFLSIGGSLVVGAPKSGIPGVVPCAAAAVTFFALNVSLVTLYIAVDRHVSITSVLRQQRFLSYAMSMFVLALLGLVLAEALDIAGPIAVLLVAAPFIVARQTIRAYEELKDAYVETVRCLVSTIEAKDKYTKGHSERVAKYASLICEGLHLNHQIAERVEFAALLHDVGKIAVDSAILQKQGSLTHSQYEEIKRHPLNGAQIIGSIELLSDIVPIIRAHHERIDGTGYPDGLEGSEIPLESRILAVADCYDAMTSNRPYRNALSVSAATAELQKSAGAQLDRPVVAAFLEQIG